MPCTKAGVLVALVVWAPLCAPAQEAGPAQAVPVSSPEVPVPAAAGAPSLQMSTDSAYPALNFGTYQPMGQVEARGVRVAPFTVRTAVQTAIGYDDNVALRQSNKIGSLFFTVAPSVSVGLEGATERYHLVYRGNYGVYASSTQDDYDDHNVVLSAANSWTTRFRTLATYEYMKGHTPRGISTSSRDVSERWYVQSVRAGASYGAEGAQGRIEGSAGHSSRRYSSDTAGAASGEYDRLDLEGTFSYRVAPKTRALVQLAGADIDNANDPSLSNTEMRYMLGVTWEALAKTTGGVRVGYTTKDFSSGVRPDFSGASYEASVTWRPRTSSVVDLTAGRFFSESYETGSDFVVNNVFSTEWNHLWARGVRSTLSYVYGRARHEGLGRTDTYHNLGARLSYPIRRSLRVGAELRRDLRDSDAGGLDYTRNLMLVTLETAL